MSLAHPVPPPRPRSSAAGDAPVADAPDVRALPAGTVGRNLARTRPVTRAVCLAFAPAVPMDDVAGTLELALLAAESLHGADRLRLDAAWAVDPAAMTVTLDTASPAGRTLALVFLGYARREFGDAAVGVHRVGTAAATGEVGR